MYVNRLLVQCRNGIFDWHSRLVYSYSSSCGGGGLDIELETVLLKWCLRLGDGTNLDYPGRQ